MEKEYTFGDNKVSIDGTEELHELMGALITEKEELKTQLQSKPDLASQLKVWEKAKPYCEENDIKIDYSRPIGEVMKDVVSKKYEVDENTTAETIDYLFHKVLPDMNQVKGKDESNLRNNGVTPISSRSSEGKSSIELAAIMAKKRQAKKD